MTKYHKIIEEADSYANMAISSFKKKKFDNKFLLSLITIAFEKFMVACLISKNNIPNGHSLSFLIKEMTQYTKVEKSTFELLIDLDEKIQLCSLENIIPYIPADKEMETILASLTQIQELVKAEIIAAKTT